MSLVMIVLSAFASEEMLELIGLPLIIFNALVPIPIFFYIKKKEGVDETFGVTRDITFTEVVIHHEGLPNFLNDTEIRVMLDKANECVCFCEGKSRDVKTTLKYEKLVSVKTGTKGSTKANKSTAATAIGGVIGGTTGAIIGSTTGQQAPNDSILILTYRGKNEEKEIIFHEASKVSLLRLKNLLDTILKNSDNYQEEIEL